VKKVALILVFFLLCVGNLVALNKPNVKLKEASLVTSYENNTSFEDKLKVSIGLSGEGYRILLSEHSIKKIDLDVRLGHEKANGFYFIGLANSSYSYALGGFSGLGFLANYALKIEAFTFKFAAGIQAAVSYSPYQEKALFSFTPLVEGVVAIELERFKASIYLNFADPYEREWKALPTIGLKTEFSTSSFLSISADAFVKFAEFMTDPVTLIMAYGFRLGCIVNFEGLGL
jgi:hypothetical protein